MAAYPVKLESSGGIRPHLPPVGVDLGIILNPPILQFPGEVEGIEDELEIGDDFYQKGKLLRPVSVTFTHTGYVVDFPVNSVVYIYTKEGHIPDFISLEYEAETIIRPVIADDDNAPAPPPNAEPRGGSPPVVGGGTQRRRRTNRRRSQRHRRSTRRNRN
jgi:hypothetical protein